MRLRGGFGTPCDAVYSGFVEIYHFGEWGAICNGRDDNDHLAADVVCRQLGFPHGTVVDPMTNQVDDYSSFDYGSEPSVEYEEAEEPQGRFWLDGVQCRGPEQRLVDCSLGKGLRRNNAGCGPRRGRARLTIACRTFAVDAALENVTTAGARATSFLALPLSMPPPVTVPTPDSRGGRMRVMAQRIQFCGFRLESASQQAPGQ